MAARIYSTRFEITPDDAINGHYLVPDGYIAVVRDMRFWLPNGGLWPDGPVNEVSIDGPGNVIWTISGQNPNPGVYSWQGRQVFQVVLSWLHWSTTARLTASGYLFTVPT